MRGRFPGMSEETLSNLLHEDRRFEGTEELVKRGFEIAYRTLRPLAA